MSNDNKYSKYTNTYGQTIPGAGYIGDSAAGDEYSIKDMDNHVLNMLVLSAKKINEGEYESQLASAIKDVDGDLTKVNEALLSIDSDLSYTNSDAFYHGANAKSERGKLVEMQSQLNLLSGNLHALQNNGKITAKVNEYNASLPQLKRGQVMKLLLSQANSINSAGKHLYNQTHTETFRGVPQDAGKYNDERNIWIETSFSKIDGSEKNDGTAKYHVTVDETENIDLSDIKCSGSLEWPWEISGSDIQKLQERITGLGYTLTYNPDSVDYDA